MAVALVGSVGAARATTGTTLTGTYGQTPTANNALIAIITRTSTTASGAWSVTGPSGWTRLGSGPYLNNTASASQTGLDIWGKIAAGGDTAPAFTFAGGGGTVTIDCTIYELSGANTTVTNLLDTIAGIGTFASGASSSTIASITTTTPGHIDVSGEFAISCAVRERAAGTTTITYSTSWVNGNNDGSTSSTGHTGVAHFISPTSGSADSNVTSFSSTSTTCFGCGVIFAVLPAGITIAPAGAATVSPTVNSVFVGPIDQVEASSSGSTTLTWTHVARPNSNGMLVVCANIDAASDSSITSVTCTVDGKTMIGMGRQETNTGAGNGFLEAWKYPGQISGGNHTVVITVAGLTPTCIIGNSASVPGSVSLGLLSEANADSTPQITVSGIAGGNLVVGWVASGSAVGSIVAPSVSNFNVSISTANATGSMAGGYSFVGFTGTGAFVAATGPAFSGYQYAEVGDTDIIAPTFSGSPPQATKVPALVQAPLIQVIPQYRADAGSTLPKGASGPVTIKWSSSGSSVAAMGIEFQQPGPLRILTPNMPTAYEDYSYSEILEATGGSESGYTWSIVSGSLPSWATLNGATGNIFGNPPSGSSGSSTFTVQVTDSSSNTTTASFTLTTQVFSGSPYITGIVTDPTTGGYFVNQLGQPTWAMLSNPWALLTNAGAYTNTWQQDIDGFLNARSSQGYKLVYVTAIGCLDVDATNQAGNTWDGVTPFNNGQGPDQGLNNTFWTRADYLFTEAANKGMTVMFNICYTASSGEGCFDTHSGVNGALYNLTITQYTAYGNALGLRYRNTPNLIWMYGNDYFPASYTFNIEAAFQAVHDAIVATGDQHIHAVHNYPESTERYDVETGTGAQLASLFSYYNGAFNFVYSYNVLYYGTELAYEEAATHSIGQLPAIWGDGYFYTDGASISTDQLMQQMVWWAIAAGGRGATITSNNEWPWASTSLTDVQTEVFPATVAGVIRTYLEGLPGWQRLMPDTGSVLVTAGRGTHASGITTGSNYLGGTDNYVVASRTPDTGSGSTLAIIYCAKAMSITIDQTKMVSGYSATWIDPATAAQTVTTTGSTYNSTPLGNNSKGWPDWVLILQAPNPPQEPAVIQAGPTPRPPTAQSQFIKPQIIAGHVIPSTTASAGAATVSVNANSPIAVIQPQAGAATTSAVGDADIAVIQPQAGVATVSAVGDAPTAVIQLQAGAATANVVASGPTITVAPNAGAATVNVIGDSAISVIAAQAGAATVNAIASNATVLTGNIASAGAATVSVIANGPVAVVQPQAGAATATAAAQPAVAAITAFAGAATVGAVAGGALATVQPQAGAATVAATGDPAVAIVEPAAGAATVNATANAPTIITGVIAGAGPLTGSAVPYVPPRQIPPQVIGIFVLNVTTANAGAATVNAVAGQVTPVIEPQAGSSTVSVIANNPNVLTGVVAVAGAATVNVTAIGPTIAIDPQPIAATVSANSNAPTASVTAMAGAATVNASCPAVQAGCIMLAGSATVAANVSQLIISATVQAQQALVEVQAPTVQVVGTQFPGTVSASNEAVDLISVGNAQSGGFISTSNMSIGFVSVGNSA